MSKIEMYRFCKLVSLLQSLDMSEVGHPSVDVLQIEYLEDGVVLHRTTLRLAVQPYCRQELDANIVQIVGHIA